MKITNTKSGKAYQLSPGTQIEIERPNLFFNEWGEQSLPVDLPDTDTNRALCGYPDMLGNKQRPRADIECSIQDGDYYQPARQAILGARRKESITTSFYINEGSFLAKVDDTLLSEVFGDETVPGVETVQQGIDFCRRLANGTSEAADRFAIFPVVADWNDQKDDYGYTIFRHINRYGKSDGRYWKDDWMEPTEGLDFYNAVDRTEGEEGKAIQIPAGCYISPFIKANYLLRRILQHFGYTLEENFFTRTTPFANMVFVNNCMDTLLNGKIRMIDLVPDCTCGDILNVFRKKFCCEFITDEVRHTATIRLFNEIINEENEIDLTPYVVGKLLIESPDEYKQIAIHSEEFVGYDYEVKDADNLKELFSKYRYIYCSNDYDHYVRLKALFKFTGGDSGHYSYIQNSEMVATPNMLYKAGDELTVEEIQVPDKLITFRKAGVLRTGTEGVPFIYIGKGKFIHSTLVSQSSDDNENDSESGSENETCSPMLAFSYFVHGYAAGTVNTNGFGIASTERLWDYTLSYIGPFGIFEKFYRQLDNLYRNSLINVTANLLLPDHLKQAISSHHPITLDGQRLLPNVLKFTIGGNEDPVESTFYTMRLYEPVSIADEQPSRTMSTSEYRWKGNVTSREITKEEYDSYPNKDQDEIAFYPDEPQEKYADGQLYYVHSVARQFNRTYLLWTVGLTCEKR